MRTREIEMLNDTLKIFEEGFYIKGGGEKKGIKLSKKELHTSNYTEEEKNVVMCACRTKEVHSVR